MRVVHIERHLYGISSPVYNATLHAAANSVPGMRWDPAARAWVGYADAVAATCDVIAAETGEEVEDADELTPTFDHEDESATKRSRFIVNYADGRKYQREDLDFALRRTTQGVLIAWDMGGGKTWLGLRLMKALAVPALIVCPNSARGVWGDGEESQVKKWWPEAWPPRMLSGTKPPPLISEKYCVGCYPHPAHATNECEARCGCNYHNGVPKLTVCHYDILHAWKDHLDYIRAVGFDECHLLGNGRTRRSEAAREIARRATYRFGLSGTPMTNRPKDLYNVVDTLSEERFGKYFFRGEEKSSFGARYCVPPNAPVWMGDLSFQPIGNVRPGDTVIGWEDGRRRKGRTGSGHTQRKLIPSRVLAVVAREAELVDVVLASGRTVRCTKDHHWLNGNSYHCKYPWIVPASGKFMAHVIDEPPALDPNLEGVARWLGGMFDGEGHCGSTKSIAISQSIGHNPDVFAAIRDALEKLEIPFSVGGVSGSGDCYNFYILGGRQHRLNFLTWTKPIRRKGIVAGILGARFKEADRIIAVRPAGSGTVVSMRTSTGNYVVYGYASSNCDAHQEQVTPTKRVWKFDGASHQEELAKRMQFLMRRRTKADMALELPPLTRSIVEVDVRRPSMPRNLLLAAPGARASEGGINTRELRRALDVAADQKLPHVVEMLEDDVASGARIVCFTFRRSAAEYIANGLKARGVDALFFHGGVAQRERDRRIARKPQVLIATIDTAGVAIDLTFANEVVFAELTYEPHELLQAESRAHRFGQKLNTLVKYVIARGTADVLIKAAVLHKLAVFEKVIGGGGGLEKDLTASKAKSGKDALKRLYDTIMKESAA